MASVDTTAIDDFIRRVRAERSPWLHVSLVEANALTAAITLVLNRLAAFENGQLASFTAADGGPLR